MKWKATIDNVALSALVFAVVAIAAVSTVAIVSADKLVAVNEKILQTQRIISSLEAIRFYSLALETGEQHYTITGNERDLGPYRLGNVEMEAELAYLAGKRDENVHLAAAYPDLTSAVQKVIESEKSIVETRRTGGFEAVRTRVGSRLDEALHAKLLGILQKLLVQERNAQDVLETDQINYGAKVRRLIYALISSSAFILVFIYGTLHRLNIEQRAAQARFAHQATHDALTGLYNRHAVTDHISTRLRDAETEAALGGFALLLLDLDGFKEINDQLGHDAGDELLRQCATRASRVLRDADYLARLGGDEFLIVIPQVSDRGTAALVAEKLITAIGEPYLLNGSTGAVTASIGIGMFPRDARDRESLMKCADLALYEAKDTGRNRVCFFELGLGARKRR